MHFEKVAEPCKNFCFMNMISVMDPKDGMKKLVYSTLAAGRTGGLVVLDPQNPSIGEYLELPGDEGAWALLNYRDEKVLVGTCGQYGYLHSLDLKTRTWAKPLSVEGDRYIWNLALGSDGMVYGGTWPGCSLLQYDPAAHTLVKLGRASENEKNMYSRMVYADPYGRIYVSIGYGNKEIRVWDIASKTWSTLDDDDAYINEVYEDFIAVDKKGRREYYDLKTLQKIDEDLSDREHPKENRLGEASRALLRESDGTQYGFRGQQAFVLRPDADKPEFIDFPVDAPPTAILEMTWYDGQIWGASALGQTIFSYDPKTGANWNSNMVCERGGEVYSIVPIDGKLFMAAYAGGDHVVYDPKQPFNQMDNINPKSVFVAGPKYFVRPNGKSVRGPDGAFWTAWMAPYGTYGGGMTRIEPVTYEVEIYQDIVPGLAFSSLATDGDLMYLTTVPTGNGLPEQKGKLMVLIAVNTKAQIIRQRTFEDGLIPELFSLVVIGNLLVIGFRTAVGIYEKNTFAEIARIPMETKCTLIKADGNDALAFTQRYLYRIDTATAQIKEKTLLPLAIFGPEEDPHGMEVHAAVYDDEGTLYFSQHGELFKVVND